MILKQYYLGCLAHASYLIADQDSGEAAVVDPQRDVEQYVADAGRLGCRIAHVFFPRRLRRRSSGAPDLRASLGWSARQLASMLHDSLHQS